jgi:hypothetical protein
MKSRDFMEKRKAENFMEEGLGQRWRAGKISIKKRHNIDKLFFIDSPHP